MHLLEGIVHFCECSTLSWTPLILPLTLQFSPRSPQWRNDCKCFHLEIRAYHCWLGLSSLQFLLISHCIQQPDQKFLFNTKKISITGITLLPVLIYRSGFEKLKPWQGIKQPSEICVFPRQIIHNSFQFVK